MGKFTYPKFLMEEEMHVRSQVNYAMHLAVSALKESEVNPGEYDYYLRLFLRTASHYYDQLDENG